MVSELSHEDGSSLFSIGKVLAHSFSTFFKHPFVFLGLSILAQTPGFVILVLMRNPPRFLMRYSYSTLGLLGLIVFIVNFIFSLAIQGTIAYGVYEVLRSKVARFGTALSHGMARIGILVLAVLSYSVRLIVLVFVVGFILIRVLGLLGVAILGLLLAALWCKWSVFVPACVVERLGPIKCLHRSSDLTKGCRLRIAALYLLCFFIIVFVIYVLAYVNVLVSAFFLKTFGRAFTLVFLAAIRQLVTAVPVTLVNIVTAVIYYNLREVKEGVGIDQLAEVFD